MPLLSIPNAYNISHQAVEDLKDSGDVVLSSLIGAPNGVAGLDSDGNIVATVVHRYAAAATLAAIVLKNGEIAVASDTKDVLCGDGVTSGGVLVSGGIRAFNVGPVEVTSTSVQNTAAVTCVPGIYRWWGVAGFSGDSDNISNFAFTTGGAVATLDQSQSAQIGSYWGTFSWRQSKSTWFEAPTILDWYSVTQATFGLFTAVAPTLTLSSARCNFDYYLNVGTSHTRNFSIKLRTAKVGTPTILGSYRLFVQRVG